MVMPEAEKNLMMLWYRQPARSWSEALPLGNGRLGAMVYGNTGLEKIDLSEITCFSGEAGDGNPAADAPEHFMQARRYALAGDYEKAKAHINGFIGKRQNYGTNLPLGHLVIQYRNRPRPADSYKRSLRLNDGLAGTFFTSGKTAVDSAAFVSNPHHVLAVRITSRNGQKLDLTIGMDGAGNHSRVACDVKGDLLLDGEAFESVHSDGKTGVRFHGRLRVTAPDGEIRSEKGAIEVRHAGEVLIYLAVHMDFKGAQPERECLSEIERASLLGYHELLRAHIRDFRALFDRVNLTLEGENLDSLPTDERVERVRKGGKDNGLAALMFQYGRYLLLSSSRPDSPLPAHLQGVWNDSVACRIGWTCDMHLDINTQMNYWPAEVTNLSECHLPLLKWVERDLVPSGMRTAKKYYGMDGWVAELVSNAWGYTAPYWHCNLSPCPTGGVWIATHLWEHYLFTCDRKFLREHAYPVIEKSVRFFMEYIFQDPETGKLTSGPSISPENSFLVDGKAYTSSVGPAYEIAMIRELFDIFIKASRILNLDDGTAKVEQALGNLQDFQTDGQGCLKEWLHDYRAKDPQHRHTSHLLSLFPFCRITPEKTPELAQAVRRSIRERVTPEENWEDTGWSRSLLLLYSARLHDRKSAYEDVVSMQKNLTNDNLMILHPPTRGAPSFANVYELDGNTGLTAGIAEMLLQSHDDEIQILPALPEQWAAGSVAGLCARGGFVVELSWENGCMTETKILSRCGAVCNVRYGGRKVCFPTQTGRTYRLDEKFIVPEP